MVTSKRLTLTDEATHQLHEGISLIFSRWREIEDAVNLGFGGPYTREKAIDFEYSVFNFFIQANGKRKESLDIVDLEDLLWKGLESLCLITCDDIVEEVANKLMRMHEECLEGNYQSIQMLREALPIPYVTQRPKDDDDDDDDDDENKDVDDALGHVGDPSMKLHSFDNLSLHEVAPEAMEVDEWITVTRKKNKGKIKGLKK